MKTALIIVDVQNDFLPGGALGVDGGDQVIPEIEQLATTGYDLIVTTGDWHPAQTKHFEKWPVHCVAGTEGASLAPAISVLGEYHIRKGDSTDDDGYSGFEGMDTGKSLLEILREQHVGQVDVVGLALDYCVRATALDAQMYGFKTSVFLNATRPVAKETGDEAIEALKAAGVTLA